MAVWSREEYIRLMTFGSVERPMLVELFGPLAQLEAEWVRQGATSAELSLDAFGFDRVETMQLEVNFGPLSGIRPRILRETEAERITIDEYGRTMRLVHSSATLPLPLDHPVREPDDWLRVRDWFRLDPIRYAKLRLSEAKDRQATGALSILFVPGAFDLPRQLLGEEALCYLYYDEPELIADILDLAAAMVTDAIRQITRELVIDVISIHEDMAGKSGPLIGPSLVRESMLPYYRRIWDLASGSGSALFSQDSDGDMSVLVDSLIDCGINVMYPAEPASGMDMVALRQRHGRRMAFKGGIDKHVLRQGRDAIDAELDRTLGAPGMDTGICFGLDHRIPNGTPLAAYRYYVAEARRRLGFAPDDRTTWARMAF